MRSGANDSLRASAIRAQRMRPTREGMIWVATALFLGFVGWFKSLNLLLLFAYFMLALAILNVLLARRQLRRVMAEAIPLPPIYSGELVRVAVRIRNGSAWPATLGVEMERGSGRGYVDRLAGGSEVECGERRSFAERGRIAIARAVIWSGYPFGFVRYERRVGQDDEIVVLPAVGEADPEGLRKWLFHQLGSGDRSRQLLRRATADQAEVRGVRPYRSGDSQRWVHWRSSARRGELMVREYDAEPASELLLLVEPWLPLNPTSSDRADLEAALSLVATIVRTWCRHMDARFTLGVLGPAFAVYSGPPSERAARDALTLLADVEGAASFPIAPHAFGSAHASAARLLVGTRPNSPTASALTRASGRPFAVVDPSVRLSWYQPPDGRARV